MSALKLDAAKRHLNVTGNASDAEVQSFVDAAESRLAKRVGPLSTESHTQRVTGGGSALVLSVTPIASLTTVADASGAEVDTDLLHIDAAAGLVTLEDGSCFTSRHYDVAYVAGRSTVPAHLTLATKELLRHLWKTQRGMMRPDVENDPSATFSLPRRVVELIEGDEQNLGFA